MTLTADQTVEALRAAGEPTRLRVLSLLAADVRCVRPGVEDTPWRRRALRLSDPSGNRLILHAKLPATHHPEESP